MVDYLYLICENSAKFLVGPMWINHNIASSLNFMSHFLAGLASQLGFCEYQIKYFQRIVYKGF